MLTIENCKIYLENYFFTNVEFLKEEGSNLYFEATDEDEERKLIEFEPDNEQVIVSVKLDDGKYYILEILSPED